MDGESHGQAGWLLAGPAPGSVIGGYRVEARLGAGGMAVVYRARDEELDRVVALKVLSPALADDAEFRERFIRESRSAARVDHPHIIPVHRAGDSEGVLYLAMRFVPGGDLRSVIAREGPLSGERAAALLSPVASALDAAHAAGLVHRDVKPANILIDISPGRPDHPYLSDFGLAKGTASAAGLTGTGQFVGTPDYAAPEQISGKPPGPQGDQYALACVTYTALTGALPFARDTSLAVLWAQVYDPPPLVRARRADLPAAVDDVLARALAKDPERRYRACGEFADALRAALSLGSYGASRPAVKGGWRAEGGAGRRDPAIGPGFSSPPARPPAQAVTPVPTAAPAPRPSPASTLSPGPPRRYSPTEFPAPRGAHPAGRRRALLLGGGLAASAVTAAVITLAVSPPGAKPPAIPAATKGQGSRAPATQPAPAASGSLLTDRQAGLSYGRLPAPWRGTSCPASLKPGEFTWTAGQYAAAGQVKGGAVTWYGEACSGPLSPQTGYTSTSQLQAITENLARKFEDGYYSALTHVAKPQEDQPVEVSGHAAWEVTYAVSYTSAAQQGATWAGEQAAVVVIDNGTKEPAVFFTSVPRNLGEATVGTLVQSLQLTP